MRAIHLIFVILLMALDNIWSEWIDMPQFSDEARIYRIPVNIYNSNKNNGEKIGSFLRENQNVSDNSDKLGRGHEIGTNLRNYSITRMQIVSPVSSILKSSSNDNVDKSVDISNIEESTIANLETTSLHSDDAKDNVIVINKTYSTAAQVKSSTLNDLAVTNTTYPCSTNILSEIIDQQQMSKVQNVQYDVLSRCSTFLDSLPINILGTAHRKLKLQSTDINKKLTFLKAFETILINAIESRFGTIFTHGRKVRGISEHGHIYDDRDDHGVGFPSVEGALMAISFLTFAVYLVRLVMLLFQNMNGSVAVPTSTTLFLGKRKRSVDHIISYDTLKLPIHAESFTIKP